jgi:transposase InsO family protein
MRLTARALGFKQLFTTPRMPSTNGMIERFHGFLKGRVRVWNDQHLLNLEHGEANWNVILPYIVHAYDSTPNKMTGQSPYALVYAVEPRCWS